MNRLERLILMAEEINRGTYPSVDRLCEIGERKRRQIQNDIAYIRDIMGIPVKWDPVRKGYYNEDPEKKLPDFDLNEGELFALTLGKDMLTAYGGTVFEPILAHALTKIEARMPDKVKISLSDISSIVQFKGGNGMIQISRKLFLDLSKACEDRHVVGLSYVAASDGQSRIRPVEPYKLLESRGAWYLIAWCRYRGAMRIFALHRITECKVTTETFAPRDREFIEEYVESAFQLEHRDAEQQCTIWFDQEVAVFIRERRWHPSQELNDHDDGSCTLSFSTTSLDEVKRWVLSYGAQAEVTEPAALRKMVQEEFQRGAQRYAKVAPISKVRHAAQTSSASKGTKVSESAEQD